MNQDKLTKKERKELKKQEWVEKADAIKRNQLIKKIGIWSGVTVLLIASFFGLIKLAEKNSSSSVLSSQAVNIKPVSKADVAIGNLNAKAVLIEYSDFQCPACARYQPLIKQIISDFEGKILFIYRFFPLVQTHENAMLSSEAAYSAHLQGKFIEMSDMLFDNQDKWAHDLKAIDLFLSYAKGLNLDLEKFKNDMNSESTKRFINDEMNEAISAGIDSTPTFFLNGKKIQFQSYEEFKRLIEAELR